MNSLYAGGSGGWVLFAGRVGGAGGAEGDALYATPYAGGCWRVGSVSGFEISIAAFQSG